MIPRSPAAPELFAPGAGGAGAGAKATGGGGGGGSAGVVTGGEVGFVSLILLTCLQERRDPSEGSRDEVDADCTLSSPLNTFSNTSCT